jgi:hypothetical protein
VEVNLGSHFEEFTVRIGIGEEEQQEDSEVGDRNCGGIREECNGRKFVTEYFS